MASKKERVDTKRPDPRRFAVDVWSSRAALTPSERALLEAVVAGHRDETLALVLGVTPQKLEWLVDGFQTSTGMSVYAAAISVQRLAARIRSRNK